MDSNAVALQKIISSYCPWTYDHIDLTQNIQGKYVSGALKDSFCDDICNQWPTCDCTGLHNEMFVTLKTGDDILAFI